MTDLVNKLYLACPSIETWAWVGVFILVFFIVLLITWFENK